MAAIAWYVLQSAIIADEGSDSVLRGALGRDRKGRLSPLIYVGAIMLAFVSSCIAIALYSFVAVLWLVPDRRIERALRDRELRARKARSPFRRFSFRFAPEWAAGKCPSHTETPSRHQTCSLGWHSRA
jgi:hypothetical protein